MGDGAEENHDKSVKTIVLPTEIEPDVISKEAGRLTTTPLCSMLNNAKERSLNLSAGRSVNILMPLKGTALTP
jgi:hypothetical protein